jgi:phosphoesterase RecJ-like protein
MPDMVPRNLHFLSGMRYVVVYTQQPEKAIDAIAKADMIFSLDYNALHRIDKLSSIVSESKAYKVLIDHHLDPEPFSDLTISHPEISSTCELIFRVIWQMGHYRMMGRSSAEAIYTGMMTDTGNFTYNSNQPEIYNIVALLVKKHIDKDQIYTLACNTQTANKLLLNSYAICNKMELFPEYGAAMIYLTREEMTSYNFQKGDCDGLVNVPLSIKGIYFSVFIREDKEYIKISLRSQGDFAVNTIASEHFGGGGHMNAAGGEFYGTLDEAIAKFREVLPLYCEKK